jgi:hypothetical protein
MLVYDWRAQSSEQFEAVERLVERYDRVFVRMVSERECEAIVLHWGLLDRYMVELDGFSVKVESRKIIRRRWVVACACLLVGALILPVWNAGASFGETVGVLFFTGLIGLVLCRIAFLILEDVRAPTFVPDLKHWVPLEPPGDNG